MADLFYFINVCRLILSVSLSHTTQYMEYVNYLITHGAIFVLDTTPEPEALVYSTTPQR